MHRIADEHGHLAGPWVDDPVLEQAIDQILLPLRLVVAHLAPLGDDLDGQRRNPAPAEVFRGPFEDDGDVGTFLFERPDKAPPMLRRITRRKKRLIK